MKKISHVPVSRKLPTVLDLDEVQHHLTSWFSHYFTECQFVWSGEFNDKLIEKSKADIVIGQSVERFLRLVPRF
jgi:hypothetical protein